MPPLIALLDLFGTRESDQFWQADCCTINNNSLTVSPRVITVICMRIMLSFLPMLFLLLALPNASRASQPQESLDQCNAAVGIAASNYAGCLSNQLPAAPDAGESVSDSRCGPKLAEQVRQLRTQFVDEMRVDEKTCGLDSASIKGMAARIRQAMKHSNRLQGAALSSSETASLATAGPEVSNAAYVCAQLGGIWASETQTCSGADTLGSDGTALICEGLGGSWSDAGSVCTGASRCQVMGLCGPCGFGSTNIPDVPCTSTTMSDFSCDVSPPETATWQAGIRWYAGLQNDLTLSCQNSGGAIISEIRCAGAAAVDAEADALCAILVPNYDVPVPIALPTAPPSAPLPPGSWSASCESESWDGSTLCANCATPDITNEDVYSCQSCPADYENLLGILSCSSG